MNEEAEVKSPQRADYFGLEKESSVSWGKTPSGRVFRVPVTHDMLENLFASIPSLKTHTVVELVTLTIVAFHTSLFLYVLVGHLVSGTTDSINLFWRIYFGVAFVCWRLCYNAGLGLVLKRQSEAQFITKLCLNTGYFDKEESAKTKYGKIINRWLRQELSKKMGNDYNFDVGTLIIIRVT